MVIIIIILINYNTVTALLVSGTGGTWSSPKAVFVSHLLSMVWVVCVDAGADDAQ